MRKPGCGRDSILCSSQRPRHSRTIPSSSGIGTHGAASSSRKRNRIRRTTRSSTSSAASRIASLSRKTSTACIGAQAAARSSSCTATSAASDARAKGPSPTDGTRSKAASRAAPAAARCSGRMSYGSARRCHPAALNAAEALARRCDLMLVVGTSAEVYPAAALPAVARSSGAIVVEINPDVTALTAERRLFAARARRDRVAGAGAQGVAGRRVTAITRPCRAPRSRVPAAVRSTGARVATPSIPALRRPEPAPPTGRHDDTAAAASSARAS